jgi:hypothetical protein
MTLIECNLFVINQPIGQVFQEPLRLDATQQSCTLAAAPTDAVLIEL